MAIFHSTAPSIYTLQGGGFTTVEINVELFKATVTWGSISCLNVCPDSSPGGRLHHRRGERGAVQGHSNPGIHFLSKFQP